MSSITPIPYNIPVSLWGIIFFAVGERRGHFVAPISTFTYGSQEGFGSRGGATGRVGLWEDGFSEVMVLWVGGYWGGAGISFIPALSPAQVSSSYCVQEPLLAFQ